MDPKVATFLNKLFDAHQRQQNINLAVVKFLIDLSGKLPATQQGELGPALKAVLDEIKDQQETQRGIHEQLKQLHEDMYGP